MKSGRPGCRLEHDSENHLAFNYKYILIFAVSFGGSREHDRSFAKTGFGPNQAAECSLDVDSTLSAPPGDLFPSWLACVFAKRHDFGTTLNLKHNCLISFEGVHGVPEVPSVFDCILAGFSLHGLLESTIILISWLVLRFAFQTATNKALRRIRLSRSAMFWIQFAFSLLLSVIVYPVMLVERRWILQEFLLPYEERSANVWTLVARIYSREGFAGFFAGWIEMVRSDPWCSAFHSKISALQSFFRLCLFLILHV